MAGVGLTVLKCKPGAAAQAPRPPGVRGPRLPLIARPGIVTIVRSDLARIRPVPAKPQPQPRISNFLNDNDNRDCLTEHFA